MSEIKSYSVGNGDMFYIKHNSDNFTIIDCCLPDDSKESILDELHTLSREKGITRFISSHPDEDHIGGLDDLDDRLTIVNFYCVKNNATKEEETSSFQRYCQLRDSDKVFHIFTGCTRRWMNESNEERKTSGIEIRWPTLENDEFKAALEVAEEGGSPNNISPIVEYSVEDGVKVVWMGDLETDFMEAVADEITIGRADIVFAPHHGRDSGRIPDSLLEKLDPQIIVVGEAPSEHLHYYPNYNTITQNSAGDIIFDCVEKKVHIYTSLDYEVDFLSDEGHSRRGFYYLGTLATRA